MMDGNVVCIIAQTYKSVDLRYVQHDQIELIDTSQGPDTSNPTST